MQLKISSILLLFVVMVVGCANHHSTPPAKMWGGVGFLYESGKDSSSAKISHTGPRVVVGFEKELGDGLGIGAEVAGRREEP